MDIHTKEHLHESPFSICFPLLVLAVPSVILGVCLIKPLLFDVPGWFGQSIFVLPQHNGLKPIAEEFSGSLAMAFSAFHHLPFWLVIAGISIAWLCYVKFPSLPEKLAQKFNVFYHILVAKYGFDNFNQWAFVQGSVKISKFLYQFGDIKVIDNFFVLGSARAVALTARIARLAQSGYLYHYAMIMVIGLIFFLTWILWAY